MQKIFVATRKADRHALLEALRAAGVLHVHAVDAAKAVADEKTSSQLNALHRARQILLDVEPAGEKPPLGAAEAAGQVLAIQRSQAERKSRLTSIHLELEHMALWGDVRLEQFEQLESAGLCVRFFSVPAEDAEAVNADFVRDLGELPEERRLIAAVTRDGEPERPDAAEEMERPAVDRPTLLAEAKEIDEQLKAAERRLGELAHCRQDMTEHEHMLSSRAEFTVADRSGMDTDALFAIQGWCPIDEVDALAGKLREAGVPAAVAKTEPDEDELPPTLIRYPRWARPIKALFDILGTIPGYREMDIAPFFMLAMPVFTAMLVGDAGYGLIFLLAGILGYRKMAKAAGAVAPQLVIVFGAATVIWGMLTANYFGVGPSQMPGWMAAAARAVAPLYSSNAEAARNAVMQVSFVIGCVHLSLAHIRAAVALLPDQRGIAEIGWVGFVFGMFTLVWLMFFDPLIAPMATLWILVASWVVIVLFCSPSRNPIKRIVFGVLGNLMSIPGAFGDMLSYIRLMAVGLASYYIASAFNALALGMSEATIWALPATVLVLLLAHGLNIALCMVAIFAHGVRLNMLEFSTNAGVQWTGYAYKPFAVIAKSEGEG